MCHVENNPRMKPKAVTILALFSLLHLSGCDKNPLGTVESQGHPPTVSQVRSTPAAVFIDSLVPENGIYHLSIVVSANVNDLEGQGDIRDVQGDFVDPSGEPVQTISMKDDGLPPDSARGDGVYVGRAILNVSRAMVGRFHPFVRASDASGFQSNRVGTSLLVFRRNSRPQLSNLQAPDSVHARYGDTTLIAMSVTASDSDGLGDVKEVYFLSLNSSDPTRRFQLVDNGGGAKDLSGDQFAGDGIFTVVVRLVPDPDVTKPRYDFQFQARDATGDTSLSIKHSLFITGL